MGTFQDDTVYLVLEDFGSFGRAYRETDPGQADRQTVLLNLLSGEYRRPLRIVAFNPTEGWARDVTAEFAIKALTYPDQDALSPAARSFVERVERPGAKPEQS
jgi:hypothetical protein